MKKLSTISVLVFCAPFIYAQNKPAKPTTDSMKVYISAPIHQKNDWQKQHTFLFWKNGKNFLRKSPFQLLPNYVEGMARVRYVDTLNHSENISAKSAARIR